MDFCPHCGGVVGRDCFNAEECGEIMRQMAHRPEEDAWADLRQIVIDIVADSARSDAVFLVSVERIEALCQTVGLGGIDGAKSAESAAWHAAHQ